MSVLLLSIHIIFIKLSYTPYIIHVKHKAMKPMITRCAHFLKILYNATFNIFLSILVADHFGYLLVIMFDRHLIETIHRKKGV